MIGKNSYSSSNSRQIAIEMLWASALLQDESYPRSILKLARNRLFDLARTQDRDFVEQFILKCVSVIEHKKGASVQAIKMMIKLLKSDKIPKFIYQSYNYQQQTKNLGQYVKHLVESFDLLTKIMDDLQNFIDGGSLFEGYDNKKCVWTRLKALLYIQSIADDKTIVSADLVNRMWAMLLGDKAELQYTSFFFDWFN